MRAPRELAVLRHTVAPGDRGAFVAKARALGRGLRDCGCNHWLFEDAASPGAYLEFIEAADPVALEGALAASRGGAAAARYTEVSLD